MSKSALGRKNVAYSVPYKVERCSERRPGKVLAKTVRPLAWIGVSARRFAAG